MTGIVLFCQKMRHFCLLKQQRSDSANSNLINLLVATIFTQEMTLIGTLNHISLIKVEKRHLNFWTKFSNSGDSVSAHAQIQPNSDQESFESTIAKVGAPFKWPQFSFSSLLCSRPVVAKLSEIFSEGAFLTT